MKTSSARPCDYLSAVALATSVVLSIAMPVRAGIYDDTDSKLGGGVKGIVNPADRLEEVILFEPDDERLFRARVDHATGGFEIKGIPPGRYDLILKFDGVVVDGHSLRVPGGAQEISDEDLAAVRERTFAAEDYFNEKCIVRLQGNARRAKAFVEQIRDKPTYNPDGSEIKGKLIRRLDVIDLRKSGQIWVVKSARHQFREERSTGRTGEKLTFKYSSMLSRVRVADEVVELDAFKLSRDTEAPPQPSYVGHYREKQK